MKRKIKKFLVKSIINLTLKVNKHQVYKTQEIFFSELQEKYTSPSEYGYDKISTWTRAAQRFMTILKLANGTISTESGYFLDAACGDGMLGILAESFGMHSYLVDLEDWRDERAKRLPFSVQDLENLHHYDSNSFDIVSSFNAFEHVTDPQRAFEELIRVCRPGGYIFLEFGPLYHGPWGLHAYRSLHMPYPQFLFSKDFILTKLDELGIYDLGKKVTELQPLNQWKYSQFVSLWTDHPDCELIMQKRIKNEDHTNVIIKYPRAFQGRGLTFEDLTTQGIQVLIKKRNSVDQQ